MSGRTLERGSCPRRVLKICRRVLETDLHVIGVKQHEAGERAAGKQETGRFPSSHRAGDGSDVYVSGWRRLVVCGAMDAVLEGCYLSQRPKAALDPCNRA